MPPLKQAVLIASLLLLLTQACAQASDSIKVLIVYGSKPAKQYRGIERKWFGGIRGGHVGIQFAADKVLNFHSTQYPCHVVAKANSGKFKARFDVRSVHDTWDIFPPRNYNIDSLQRGEIVIPINAYQRHLLDSLIAVYTRQPPYDYAVLGMRCASASYDLLGKIGVLKKHNHADWLRMLLPRQLRTMLYKQAVKNKNNGWVARLYPGYKKRIWEADRVGNGVLRQITVR